MNSKQITENLPYKVKNIAANKEYIIDLDVTTYGNYIITLDINGREYIKSFVIK